MSRGLKGMSVLIALATAAGGAGCGGEDKTDEATAAKPDPVVRAVPVRLSDFKINPALNVASPGKVKITARNDGTVEHELIVVRTGANPTDLPVTHGDVDEEGLGKRVIGEISELKPGTSGAKTFQLEPGVYVVFCNVPGHYRHGMFGRLAVR